GPNLPDGLRPVFASADRRPLPAKVLSFKPGRSGELRLEVPQEAQPGWIGFSEDAQLVASNLFREALSESLPHALASHGCVRAAGAASAPAPRSTLPLHGAGAGGRPRHHRGALRRKGAGRSADPGSAAHADAAAGPGAGGAATGAAPGPARAGSEDRHAASQA